MDESVAYSFCNKKKNKFYIYTTYTKYTMKIFTKSNKTFIYSFASNKLSAKIVDNLTEKFFKNNSINDVKLYSDNAKIYQGSIFNFSCKKSKITNLVERSSVNFRFRHYCSYLTKRSVKYAKSKFNFSTKIKFHTLMFNSATSF